MFVDPIADFFVRIRNSLVNFEQQVEVRSSKLITNILQIMQEEGYIVGYKVHDFKKTTVLLKYKKNKSSISGLKQVSKPGLRIYSKAAKLPKILNGLGVVIVSTNMGLMTDKKARKNNLGGEVLAYVW